MEIDSLTKSNSTTISPGNQNDKAIISKLKIHCYSIPTQSTEADGTYEWDKTTLVLVEAEAGGKTGIGYTYADISTTAFIHRHFKKIVVGENALDIAAIWVKMVKAVRNLGRQGVASMAISAVDNALWDLKSKILNLPLVSLLGQVHPCLPIYGSGGFTSYSYAELKNQFEGWAKDGIEKFKMKVGRNPEDDDNRVKYAREIIGAEAELFVDANGAYSRKQALDKAHIFKASDVKWFEEPVSSDDLEGLRLLRDEAPAGMDIAAGEYEYDQDYFRRMLEQQSVDVLQADATRCAGITGFMQTAALCQAFHIPLSAHCAPALHLHICCAAVPVIHAEYFFDHVRIEGLLFDGVAKPLQGKLYPDLSEAGMGLRFRFRDAEKYKIG